VTDLAAVAVSFGEMLHRSGLPITPERSGRFAQAIQLVNPLTVTDLYWTARVTLVTGHDHVDVFDRVFAQVFGGMVDVADSRGDQASPPPANARAGDAQPVPSARSSIGEAGLSAAGERSTATAADEPPGEGDMVVGLTSREERLATTDFAELAADELAELQRLMQSLRLSPPLRAGRRLRRHTKGDRIDLRATLARSRRTGGDPLVHVRRRRPPRPRRLVVLCDISGSMEPYARAYLQFLHAAAGASHAEVFVFATRLTRLTKALAVPHPQLALARAAVAAPDWRGGTRIGEALKAFVDNYGRRGLVRGAVLVIVSDGWERDNPALVAEQMARLGRLANRIVWINPRSADPRYQPLTGGMVAALPHCHAIVSGHNFFALNEVIAAIAAPN
jgi:uncharacterized protein